MIVRFLLFRFPSTLLSFLCEISWTYDAIRKGVYIKTNPLKALLPTYLDSFFFAPSCLFISTRIVGTLTIVSSDISHPFFHYYLFWLMACMFSLYFLLISESTYRSIDFMTQISTYRLLFFLTIKIKFFTGIKKRTRNRSSYLFYSFITCVYDLIMAYTSPI